MEWPSTMASFDVQVIEQRHGIVAEHARRVIDRWFARTPRAAVVVHDHLMIFGEFRHLIHLPDLAVTSGLAEK